MPIIESMPFDVYRRRPEINKGILDAFARCPLHGYREWQTREQDEPTEPMLMGSAADTLVCEPDQFDSRFYIQPETYEHAKEGNKKWNNNATVCRQWHAEHSDRHVLTVKQLEEAQVIATAVKTNPHARKLLEGARVQTSLFWRDKGSGLDMKGRPDFLMDRSGADLKVIADATTEACSKRIDDNRWHIQAAIYTDGAAANEIEWGEFSFIFVERGRFPTLNIRTLAGKAIDFGRGTYKAEMRAFSRCMADNDWPDYTGHAIGLIDLPAYSYLRSSSEPCELIIGGTKQTF